MLVADAGGFPGSATGAGQHRRGRTGSGAQRGWTAPPRAAGRRCVWASPARAPPACRTPEPPCQAQHRGVTHQHCCNFSHMEWQMSMSGICRSCNVQVCIPPVLREESCLHTISQTTSVQVSASVIRHLHEVRGCRAASIDRNHLAAVPRQSVKCK